MRISTLIISGGEPLLQQKKLDWADLLHKMYEELIDVHVETNGTITPNLITLQRVSHFSVSPKLKSAKISENKKRFNDEAMRVFKRLATEDKALFKFVCSDDDDLKEVLEIQNTYDLETDTIWIMPEGTDEATIQTKIKFLADLVLDYGYNLTPRLHTLIWGSERAK
jgi:organic radical activating enzyme